MKKGQALKPRDLKKHHDKIKEQLKVVATNLKFGMSYNDAARAANVNPSTFYHWKKRAQDGEEPYATCWLEIDNALPKAEAYLAGLMYKHAQKNWQAALSILERRFPDRWTKRDISQVLLGKLEKDIAQMSDEELETFIKANSKNSE